MCIRDSTGDNAERIDTRVLQLIYRFTDANPGVLPGQVLDVYVESGPADAAAAPTPATPAGG